MIIGIAGKKRSGKDTAADMLVTHHDFIKESFAAPIRKFVGELCGLTPAQLEKHKEDYIPLLNSSPRKMMQTLGTEWGRDMISQTIWTDSLIMRIKQKSAPDTVICDVRFENEATAIRAMGGVILHIARDHVQPVDEHASEAGVYAHADDYYIPNNRTFSDLYKELNDLVKELRINGN